MRGCSFGAYPKFSPFVPCLPMDNLSDGRSQDWGHSVYFAAIGDVHGQFQLTSRLLSTWEASHPGLKLAFALQVGDLECHRDENDMATMAAPARNRHLGDFQRLASGSISLPCPVFFIGGNHECYGWLDEDEMVLGQPLPVDGVIPARPCVRPKQIAHNLYYIGRAEFLTLRINKFGGVRFCTEDQSPLATPTRRRRSEIRLPDRDEGGRASDNSSCDELVLNIAGLSGIFREGGFYERRPGVGEQGKCSNKSWIGFNCYDVNRLVDIDSDGADRLEESGFACESIDGLWESDLLQAFGRCLGLLVSKRDFLLQKQNLLRILSYVTQGCLSDAARLASIIRQRQNSGMECDVNVGSLVDFFTAKVGKSAKRRGAFIRQFNRTRFVDLLLTHDWPSGLVSNDVQLRGSRPMGNTVARDVSERLNPQVHLCGHMHVPYRCKLVPASSSKSGLTTTPIPVCCLSKVGFPHATAIFRVDWRTGRITEMEPPIDLPDLTSQVACADGDED